ncbi:hypothetical protein F511_01728 [Dorcoceras hygrometricum]|uniref:S-protein homolog n=1 Tax=Dorcoceras hygrometricum TaxID=472368 RepID=A0A2Z7AS70_9LAMI|nr:hypothetical protein F511_01727 [Dorcoceras hygrometricum]KZV24246.1 hypothetical protein F511_01728 [Dorcoceras hygrometricum]
MFLGAQSFESKKKCFFTTKYQIYVVNNLPPNSPVLSAHCRSKNDDLGTHTMASGQTYNFNFCENFFLTTLFTCNLRWRGKDKTFPAFNSKWIDSPCDMTGDCYWFAKEDGIYFSDQNPPKRLEKHYDW